MQMSNSHQPVMLENIMGHLTMLYPAGGAGLTIIDATFGRGGYSTELLKWGASVIAIDRDGEAVHQATTLKAEYGDRFAIIQANFADMKNIIPSALIKQSFPLPPQAVIFDFGVSSPQLDTPARGFSLMHDGPLDMRMDVSQSKTAMQIVNEYSESALMHIFKNFGEERYARRIADKIVYQRAKCPITTTKMLADIVEGAIMRANPKEKHKPIHPATKVFQALRIEVNDELTAIEQGIAAAADIIADKGVVICVSFHSLEDRIVKTIFNDLAGNRPSPSRHMPISVQHAPEFSLLHKKIIQASPQEIATNPRARSAKMRIIQKNSNNQ